MDELQLRDIILPSEPSYFPLAVGWWIIIVLLIALLTIIGILIYRQIKTRQHNKQIDLFFMSAITHYQDQQNTHQYAIEISDLIRRYVYYDLGHKKAATFSEGDWMHYMIKMAPKAGRIIRDQYKEAFLYAPYNPSINFDVNHYHQSILNWVYESKKNKKGG